ncbi:hypothetical protein LTR99_000893 [Exophiala xenobiotica]|uniref:Uncharacterized protein n=1 Tax=Vermiconidia calcicola TaxID=1690605 RepID=A0AAV9QMH6_9PEZI|nr:hypothetical protein LTR96_003776 [Exophiala xenobiotica]KAK5540763.1 hypothetical protein LTR23_005994 [Chaetothyriales sp. CCFEE 6169]KAK5545456.1 hypothetical protein LTR25_000463 [Vermiconidia calcicola]KAK5307921.1 hypothetical protein LTR99_000893 [Exophiala xenobiotica]KAK5343182.1 hypothetical protein LTR98_000811 [Exophiala xenobiotica]
MTLKDTYQRFLDLPNPISLAENASLHYITTLTTFSQPTQIIRHLESHNKKVVKTRSTRILSVVEGGFALALEVETNLEFISGGGVYLPGLENFVVDKIATIPTTHFVLFDADGKISQIRISWDQGSLLKQTEVIGARAKNWPLTDGKDQVRLISTSSTAAITVPLQLPSSPRGRSENQSIASSRNVSPGKKHIKDPYASLDLSKAVDEPAPLVNPNAVAPRSSAKPPPREMSELFAAGHEDHEPGSPKKFSAQPVIAPKGGASQRFAPSRLFEDDVNEPQAVGYKSDPSKYNHFDMGDVIENDPMQYRENSGKSKTVPLRPKTNKHSSQWDFDDFSTPAKVPQKVRGQDVVHFSLDNNNKDVETPAGADRRATGKPRRDNDAHFEFRDDGTPVERHVVPKPRKDAEAHFEMRDSATPAPNRTSDRPTSSGRHNGLYDNNIFDEDESDTPKEKAPLSTITNNANASRQKAFDNHWSMSDVSPANEKSNENNGIQGHQKKPSQMDAHWDTSDQTPEPVKKPSQVGLRKGMESHWSHGDYEQPTPRNQSKAQKSFWDF